MEQINLKLGYYLVAFVDVLGQRARFRALKLPRNAEEEKLVREAVRQTAGFVLDVRRVFQTQFKIFEMTANQTGVLPPESVRPKFVAFSDSSVIAVPLRNETGDFRVVAVFSALSAAAILMLTALASRHALRGGIDVELGTEIGPEEVYGTALERAYLLERDIAQYPRIVIGDGLKNYLNAAIDNFESIETPAAKAITTITKKIMDMIATDSDGEMILDYLGTAVVENAKAGQAETMVRPAYEFVLAEQKRVIAEGDAKLIQRYEKLRSYFESRLHLWGIPVNKS